MRLLLTILSFTSIWTLGLTIVTQEGMLLYKWREWADSKSSKWVEPLISCHWCMPSLHSSIGYAFAVALGFIKSFSWQLVFMYPLVVCGASTVNGLVWGYASLIMAKTEYYKKMAEEPNDEREIETETTEYYFKTNN